ncbi:MAG: hypothetical protein ACK47C_07820 [Paracoccaceae bacterium]
MPAYTPPIEFPFIPNARPHSIGDRQLAQLAQLGDDARMGNVSPAEAEWLLTSCGPLLRELMARRAAMANANLPFDNVVVIGSR